MAMDKIRGLLNDKLRPSKCCCCFSVKTGTTIIGILHIISAIGEMIMITQERELESDIDQSESTTKSTNSTAVKVIACIIGTIFLGISICMTYGNIKENTKLMAPYVIMNWIGLTCFCIYNLITILVRIFMGEFLLALLTLIILAVAFPLALHMLQVVRSRIMEIDEKVQPQLPFTQGDMAPFHNEGIEGFEDKLDAGTKHRQYSEEMVLAK